MGNRYANCVSNTNKMAREVFSRYTGNSLCAGRRDVSKNKRMQKTVMDKNNSMAMTDCADPRSFFFFTSPVYEINGNCKGKDELIEITDGCRSQI